MNIKQRTSTIFLLVMSMFISGCGSGQLFSSTLTPTPTFTLTPTPTLTLTPTPIIIPTSTITPLPTQIPCLSPRQEIFGSWAMDFESDILIWTFNSDGSFSIETKSTGGKSLGTYQLLDNNKINMTFTDKSGSLSWSGGGGQIYFAVQENTLTFFGYSGSGQLKSTVIMFKLTCIQ